MRVNVSERDAPVVYKTVEEIKAALAERGLPVDRIYPQLDFKPIKQDDVEVGKENNYPGGYGTAELHRILSGAA
jgi:hypothetical protein